MGFIKNQKNEPVDRDERKISRDCSGLLQALASPDPTARRWAARDLLDCPESSGALVERLKQEPDGSVREVILTTLTCLRDEVAVAGLVDCLRSEEPALRNEAIEAMKELPDEVAPIMDSLLRDPDADVRIFTVNILESLRHPQVEAWLREVIERDAHVNVCATAVDLLSEVGSELSREPLQRLKARFPDQPYIQFAADLALKRLGDSPS
jgi:HEAT repeat protein